MSIQRHSQSSTVFLGFYAACILLTAGLIFSPSALAGLGGETVWSAHTFNGSFSDADTTAGAADNYCLGVQYGGTYPTAAQAGVGGDKVYKFTGSGAVTATLTATDGAALTLYTVAGADFPFTALKDPAPTVVGNVTTHEFSMASGETCIFIIDGAGGGSGAYTIEVSASTDAAPFVASTTPYPGTIYVSPSTNITITFSEPVNVTGTWFTIVGSVSGAHTASVSGGPTVYTLDPDGSFTPMEVPNWGEYVTVTVLAAQVEDQDASDPPNNMTSDFVFDFSTDGTVGPDFSIDITDSPDPVVKEQPLTYTLTVTRAMGVPVNNLVVRDQLAPGVEYVSGNSSLGTVNESGGIVTATLGDIMGETGPFTITINVIPHTAGMLPNHADVTYTPYTANPLCPDLTPADNAVYEMTEVLSNEGEEEGTSEGETGCQSFTSADVPKAIPSYGVVSSTLTVPDSFIISDINVHLDITHTCSSDLWAVLKSPEARYVLLFNEIGDCDNGLSGTVLDDEADTSIQNASSPFSGCLKPLGDLSVLDGHDAQGEWTLVVYDWSSGDSGTITNWSLDFDCVCGGEGEEEGGGEGEIGVLEDCLPSSVYSQPPAAPYDDYSGPFSDGQFQVFDNFTGVSNPVTGIRWWGSMGYSGNCVREPNTYTISFYQDNNGMPGPLYFEETVTPTYELTGTTYLSGLAMYRFTAWFATPKYVAYAWLSIKGEGDASCIFGWCDSYGGDHYALQDNTHTYFRQDHDLAFCLLTGDPMEGEGGDEGEGGAEGEGEGSVEGEGETCTDPYMSPNVPQPVGNLGNYFTITGSGEITDLDLWVQLQGVSGSTSLYLERGDCWHMWNFDNPIAFTDGLYILDDEEATSLGSCMGGTCIPGRYSMPGGGLSLSDVFDGCELSGDWMMTLTGNPGGQIVNWGICVQGNIAGEGEGGAEGEGGEEGEIEGATEGEGGVEGSEEGQVEGEIECIGNVVADGGFETGSPNAAWTEQSVTYGTPLCSVDGCGEDITNPHSGLWWCWFGGNSSGDDASLAQALVIPDVPSVSLQFYLRISDPNSTGNLLVLIDGNTVAGFTEADEGSYLFYTLVSVDVSAYADGGEHTLVLQSHTDGFISFSVDDVCLSTGLAEGQVEGQHEGEGSAEGQAEGITEGAEEGLVEGEGITEGAEEGQPEGTVEGLLEGEGGIEGEGGPEGQLEGEGAPQEGEGDDGFLTADQDRNNLISLSELLRVIQFFNSNGFHCEAGTEDGYAPGPGDTSCDPYDSDYNLLDWHISLSELLRVIQFFNSNGYHYCPGEVTEDGFCPGPV